MSQDKFYTHRKWRDLRAQVLAEQGPWCRVCGTEENPQVDHILPRSTHPDLEYDKANLQVLCAEHNNQKRDKANQVIRVNYVDDRWFAS